MSTGVPSIEICSLVTSSVAAHPEAKTFPWESKATPAARSNHPCGVPDGGSKSVFQRGRPLPVKPRTHPFRVESAQQPFRIPETTMRSFSAATSDTVCAIWHSHPGVA